MNFVGVASARKIRGIFRRTDGRMDGQSGHGQHVVASSELKFH